MIVTVDVGTSVAKVGWWCPVAGSPAASGLVAQGRAPVATDHPGPDRAEQVPARWFEAVLEAAAAARAVLGGPGTALVERHGVAAVVLTGARETFVPCTTTTSGPSLACLGPGIVWSDHRAGAEAALLARRAGGAAAFHRATGHVLEAGSMVAKLLWLARHDPGLLRRADVVLAPRDVVAWELTGEVATDATMASRAGLPAAAALADDLLAATGRPGVAAGGPVRLSSLVPPIAEAATVLGPLRPGPAAALGVPSGVPVVIGAGDRACEVLGSGASPTSPMVAWGTTANVTLPVPDPPDQPDAPGLPGPPTAPDGVAVSAGALGGRLWECGLSGAGSVLQWLATLLATTPLTLESEAAMAPAGSDGVVCQPWLQGARAPWWRRDAAAAFSGLRTTARRRDLARSVFEGTADEIRRSLLVLQAGIVENLSETHATLERVPAGARPAPAEAPAGTPFSSLALGAGSEAGRLWPAVVTAVTGLPAHRRSSGEAASAGAALVAARAVGLDWDLDTIDPAAPDVVPDPEAAALYARRRPEVDAAARAVLALAGRRPTPPAPMSPGES